MDDVEMFWDGPTGSSQEYDNSANRRGRIGKRTRGERRAAAAASDQSPDEALRDALGRVKFDDEAGWHEALKQAGFSPEEANRLIFERVRPRDEGRVRAAGSA